MVVVDGPDGLIPTFNWIYPSLIKTRKKKKKKKRKHSQEKRKENCGSTTVCLFFIFFFCGTKVVYDLV